jgi:hypothetical protein
MTQKIKKIVADLNWIHAHARETFGTAEFMLHPQWWWDLSTWFQPINIINMRRQVRREINFTIIFAMNAYSNFWFLLWWIYIILQYALQYLYFLNLTDQKIYMTSFPLFDPSRAGPKNKQQMNHRKFRNTLQAGSRFYATWINTYNKKLKI